MEKNEYFQDATNVMKELRWKEAIEWLRTGEYVQFGGQETCLWEGDIWACGKIWIQRNPDRGESKCKVLKWEQAWYRWTRTSIGKDEAGKTAGYKGRGRQVWKK